MHFRLAADDPIHVKRPTSLLEFNFKYTYMPGFDPSDKLLYQIIMPVLTDPEPKSDNTFL